MTDDTRPPAATRVAHALFAVALAVFAACDTPKSVENANAKPGAEAPADTSWAVPAVERRIRAITGKNFEEFIKTDLDYRNEQARLQNSKDASSARGDLDIKMQKYWDSIVRPGTAPSLPTNNEYFFAMDKMTYKVEPETEPIPNSGEKGGPDKRRVTVTCTFAAANKAPKVGTDGRPLKSARVVYVATPHGIDRTTYGVRIAEGSEQYFE